MKGKTNLFITAGVLIMFFSLIGGFVNKVQAQQSPVEMGRIIFYCFSHNNLDSLTRLSLSHADYMQIWRMSKYGSGDSSRFIKRYSRYIRRTEGSYTGILKQAARQNIVWADAVFDTTLVYYPFKDSRRPSDDAFLEIFFTSNNRHYEMVTFCRPWNKTYKQFSNITFEGLSRVKLERISRKTGAIFH